ncbi:thioredoxin-like domain-containing protein [Chryseolinea sp. T2]|uniref:thioredoxin-like domain-containing protein n=1 Tax=Chryseolinea sp. T2 TaxID=3129255 RepID=UPI003077CA35
MKNLSPISFSLLLVVLSIIADARESAAQDGYTLNFKVTGWHDTTVYLGHHFGESIYIKDTAVVGKQGDFRFDGVTLKDHGVYFVAMAKDGKASKQFDFLITDDQQFSMTTSATDVLQSMKVTGSDENVLFYKNMKYQTSARERAAPLESILQDATPSMQQKEAAKAEYTRIRDEVLLYQDQLIAANPNSLTANIIRAYRPINVPAAPKASDGRIDSTFQFRWYKKHFFDNFELSEPGLVCLPDPLYKQKIDEYLDKLTAQDPDSLFLAATKIINAAEKNQQAYRYAAWVCLLKYQQPSIMGLDEIYVRVFDTYYASGKMNFWITAGSLKALKDQADRLRKSLIGNIGPDLVMQDASLKPQALYSIDNKYTILFIFDPDCGHCREETPKLVSFYNKKKWDVGIYAVSADSSMQKMRNYVKEMSMRWTTVNGHHTYTKYYQELYDALMLPSIFVLDKDKRIIAKQISADRLDEFFENYERYHGGNGKR